MASLKRPRFLFFHSKTAPMAHLAKLFGMAPDGGARTRVVLSPTKRDLAPD